MKKIFWALLIIISFFGLYLISWPVPIDPVSWDAPPNPGYESKFRANTILKKIEKLTFGGFHGPEDIAVDEKGVIYAATHEGFIVRMAHETGRFEKWAKTGGRPLGIDFDVHGNLIVADAYKGLLSINPEGKVKTLVSVVNNIPLNFTDDVDNAADGKIYFSDASTKFSAKEHGPLAASLLDLIEHGGHGRLLVYNPATKKTKVLVDGLDFANGVAVSADQSYVLINETAAYRVLKYWLSGPQKGKIVPIIESLPSFPDNISTGLDGRYWVALVSPRNALLDSLADNPFLRKVIHRIPEPLRPKPVHYGHIIAINDRGHVLYNFQDPDASCPMNTSVTETENYIYIGSLITDFIARLPKSDAGL